MLLFNQAYTLHALAFCDAFLCHLCALCVLGLSWCSISILVSFLHYRWLYQCLQGLLSKQKLAQPPMCMLPLLGQMDVRSAKALKGKKKREQMVGRCMVCETV